MVRLMQIPINYSDTSCSFVQNADLDNYVSIFPLGLIVNLSVCGRNRMGPELREVGGGGKVYWWKREGGEVKLGWSWYDRISTVEFNN